VEAGGCFVLDVGRSSAVSEWFVANVRDMRWQENELGATCEFDKDRERFGEFGINLTVLTPGQPMTMYHREGYQEGFLVLRGECLLVVDDQELPLKRWTTFTARPTCRTRSSVLERVPRWCWQ
jgi:hypothetical protein